MCIARRIDSKCELFKTTPQQSDYIEAWDQSEIENLPNSDKLKYKRFNTYIKEILKLIPRLETLITKLYRTLKRAYQHIFKRSFNRRDYMPFNPLS